MKDHDLQRQDKTLVKGGRGKIQKQRKSVFSYFSSTFSIFLDKLLAYSKFMSGIIVRS
ncbi:hypothetical protein [Enterococcus casseliflavus]|jgi:hypothetical protein|uniref:hypothetical protein n=1 Tax=Enterococcus casseliflavus TaxID=37734 RepID=UPI000A6CD769|nr:hypothetical protein [Enterococcus casseliflavus]QQU22300.1 hypothetical protein I6I77_12420 [Enterococcus casseliflavus]